MRRAILVGAAALAVGLVVALVMWRRGGGASSARRTPPARVTPAPGAELLVTRLTAEPLHAVVGEEVALVAEVTRGSSRPGSLTWRWIATRGALVVVRDGEARWTAPGKPGRFAVGVAVEDGAGHATAQVTIEVRLPSPEEAKDLAALMKRLRAQEAERTAALAALEARVPELRATGDRRDSIEDRLHAQDALEELAGVYEQLGRYEEAHEVWQELTAHMLPSDEKLPKFMARDGDVAFYLGDEDTALKAWETGGDYVQGMSRYYLGQVLERRGDTDGALDAYARAQGGARWYGDPVYREALLTLQGGASADDVAQMLVDASPRLDRERMLLRFEEDDELAPLRDALQATGRDADLVPARAQELEADSPDP